MKSVFALIAVCALMGLNSCSSPTATGAALGAAGGYAYDRFQNDHPEDPHNATTLQRVGTGAAIGGGLGYLYGQQQQQQQQAQMNYGGYPSFVPTYEQAQQMQRQQQSFGQNTAYRPQTYGAQPAYYRTAPQPYPSTGQAVPPPPYGYGYGYGN